MYKNKNFRSYKGASGGKFFAKKPFYGGRALSSSRTKNSFGRDINIFIKKASASSQDEKYIPTKSFTELAVTNILKENITRKGFTHLTPIQDQVIEPILQGRDLIGIANTGTGKTAAFLIPTIDKMFKTRTDKMLIIAPTRELAVQINEELRNLSFGMRIYSALVIGGSNMRRQIFDIQRNPHVVIGTPGRLKDLIQQKKLDLGNFSIFVLDEVDLMVDIGFINDVKYFISLLPEKRQSLFFSATIPPKIKEILDTFVKNPVTVSVKRQETAENIDQDVIKVLPEEKKVDKLHDLLIQNGFDKVLIFGRTKHGVEKLNKELENRGFKTGAIHGNKRQSQRMRVLESFRRNEIQILLATDVASRGLDINNVTHVINYEVPDSYEDYIHRIGRTGRANQMGKALTFVS